MVPASRTTSSTRHAREGDEQVARRAYRQLADSSSKGGKASGSGTTRNTCSQGGTKAQKAAAGRKGGKKSS